MLADFSATAPVAIPLFLAAKLAPIQARMAVRVHCQGVRRSSMEISVSMHKLLKPLRYVFYRILEWKLRDRREATPVLVAALAIVLLLFLNVITATMLVSGFRGRLLLPNFPGGRAGLSAVLLVSFYLGYNMMRLAWVDNGHYHQLEREFQSTDTRTGAFRTALFWSYLVLSVLVPFVLSIFWRRN